MKLLLPSYVWDRLRMLLAILLTLGMLICIALVSCTDPTDDADYRGTGIALQLGRLVVDGSTPSATPTRALQPVEDAEQWQGFRQGDELYVSIAPTRAGSNVCTGSYRYSATGTWEASGTPAYWASATANNIRIWSKPSGSYTLPDTYEADATQTDPSARWRQWDLLTYSADNRKATVSPLDATLQHAMAQLCIELTPGTGMTQKELQVAIVKLPTAYRGFELTANGNLVSDTHTKPITLLKNGSTSLKHHALLVPAQTFTASTGKMVEIDINGDIYSFTPTEALTLEANMCLHLTLVVNRTGVSALSVSSTGWEEKVTEGGTPEEDSEVTVVTSTAGGLDAALSSFTGTKLVVMGEMNDNDMAVLASKAKSYSITELYIMATGVKNIGSATFMDCTSLASITIPEGVMYIEAGAFMNCTSLTSITIPEGVRLIGNLAFYNCNSLTTIILPQGITTIKQNAFQNCTSLTSITLPEGIQVIADEVFSGCTSLVSITIPKGVVSISSGVFKDCTSLRTIILPEEVYHLQYDAFYGCTSLTSISLPQGIKGIGGNAFYDVPLESLIISGYDQDKAAPLLPEFGSYPPAPQNLFLRDVSPAFFALHQDAYTSYLSSSVQNIYCGLKEGIPWNDPYEADEPANYTYHWTRGQ